MTMTTNETPAETKKKRGPRAYSERLAEVQEAGKAKLARLGVKRLRQIDELAETNRAIAKLRAELGLPSDELEADD